MMELAHRRWIGRLIRFGLVAVAILVVAAWWSARRDPTSPDIRVETEAPVLESLGPGDVQIYSRDSAVNLVLRGDRILAGLSPKTIAKVRSELEANVGDDTTGLGGSIAQFVKKTVAEKIGTHVAYPIHEIRDIRYEDDEIVIDDVKGKKTRLFSSVKVNKQPLSQSFWPEDAQRFVDAVRARKRALP